MYHHPLSLHLSQSESLTPKLFGQSGSPPQLPSQIYIVKHVLIQILFTKIAVVHKNHVACGKTSSYYLILALKLNKDTSTWRHDVVLG